MACAAIVSVPVAARSMRAPPLPPLWPRLAVPLALEPADVTKPVALRLPLAESLSGPPLTPGLAPVPPGYVPPCVDTKSVVRSPEEMSIDPPMPASAGRCAVPPRASVTEPSETTPGAATVMLPPFPATPDTVPFPPHACMSPSVAEAPEIVIVPPLPPPPPSGPLPPKTLISVAATWPPAVMPTVPPALGALAPLPLPVASSVPSA